MDSAHFDHGFSGLAFDCRDAWPSPVRLGDHVRFYKPWVCDWRIFSLSPTHVVVDDSGIYCREVGRTIAWSDIKWCELKDRTIHAFVIEGKRSWGLRIDLANFRLDSAAEAVLSAWFGNRTASREPSLPSEPPRQQSAEYAMPSSLAQDANIGVLTSIFLVLVFAWMAWKIPLTGILFAPFGLALGGLASMQLPLLRVSPLRAVYHSLWIDAMRSIPWHAVQDIKLANTEKTSIQVDLRGGRYQDKKWVLESPLLINISKSVATGDEILAGLNRVFRADSPELASNPKEYVPNAFSRIDLYFSAATLLFLVVWSSFGIWGNDFVVPAKRSALHLHGLPAWLMLAAWLLAASSFASVIIDHYDRRNNESRYKRLRLWFTIGAWVFFFGSLVTNLGQEPDSKQLACSTQVLRSIDSPDGQRTAYAYLLLCNGSPATVVNISVLAKGQTLANERGNAAYIAWPKKLVDVRWKRDTVQVIHAYPWKLKPVKDSPVAVYGVAQ